MKKSGPRKDGKTNERSECVGGHRPHGEKKERRILQVRGEVYMCPAGPLSRARLLARAVMLSDWISSW
jgi:hypothetical protein